MAVDIKRMFQDYDWTGEPYQPDSPGEIIAGKRGNILSIVNYPGGKGPHPVIILCHGVPGNEKLMDYALILRHIGFCTITFHYSGSWGSDGEFSVLNSIEDADTVLQYVLKNNNGIFDVNNIFLVGYSMGGLVGAHALAENDEVKAGALIMPANFGYVYHKAQESKEIYQHFENMLNHSGKWLKSFSWETFTEEAGKNAEKFSLTTYAEKLSDKPVLTIAGTMDTDLPRGEHVDMLIDAIKQKGGKKLRELTVPTNHAMADQRNTIVRAMAEFFIENIC